MPLDLERQFTSCELKLPDGKGGFITTGYMIRCNTCHEQKTFMLSDKHRETKVPKWLAKHEHLITLAN